MIELFSGENFDAKSSKRLNRKCDFIFAKSPGSIELIAPLIDVCEAEKEILTILVPCLKIQLSYSEQEFITKKEKFHVPIYTAFVRMVMNGFSYY